MSSADQTDAYSDSASVPQGRTKRKVNRGPTRKQQLATEMFQTVVVPKVEQDSGLNARQALRHLEAQAAEYQSTAKTLKSKDVLNEEESKLLKEAEEKSQVTWSLSKVQRKMREYFK